MDDGSAAARPETKMKGRSNEVESPRALPAGPVIPVCGWCSGLIEASNVGWPGYCSPRCRDAVRLDRERQKRKKRERAEERLSGVD